MTSSLNADVTPVIGQVPPTFVAFDVECMQNRYYLGRKEKSLSARRVLTAKAVYICVRFSFPSRNYPVGGTPQNISP